MADRHLNVHMDGTLAGTVTMTGAGNLTFTYDESYRNADGATPLSLSMPKAFAKHKTRAVLPFLMGLLPDNPMALSSLASSYRVSTTSPFALLEHIGHDVAGALQFIAPGDVSEDATIDRSAMTPIGDEEIAHDLRTVISVYRTGRAVQGGDRFRMSLAGAQPKIALARTEDGSWARPDRGVPTTHIFKPEFRTPRTVEDERFPNLMAVEMFSLAVARHAGLRTPTTTYWQSPDGDLRALVLERYDRHVGQDGMVHRDHQEDLCQALSVPPDLKYQHRDGGPGVGGLGKLLRAGVGAQDRDEVARDFLAALTLNIAMVNTDAHAKNYSLTLTADQVRLAPVYDVLSFAPYETFDPSQPPISFPMKVGDGYRIRDMLPSVIASEGTRLGLDLDESRAVVDQVLHAIPGALESARDEVAGVAGGTEVVDRTIANLRTLSPLHQAPPPVFDATVRNRSAHQGPTAPARRKTTPASNRGSFATPVRGETDVQLGS